MRGVACLKGCYRNEIFLGFGFATKVIISKLVYSDGRKKTLREKKLCILTAGYIFIFNTFTYNFAYHIWCTIRGVRRLSPRINNVTLWKRATILGD